MPRANEQAWRGVPATRDFERMLGGLLVVGVTTTLTGVVVTNRALSLAALATAAVVALIAIATLRAIAMLTPPSLGPLTGRRRRPLRVAVIGTDAAALDLQAELRAGAVHQVVVAGAIDPALWPARTREPATLGRLADLGRIVDAHAIDLLLVDAPERRARVIETVMRACEGDAVRLCDLAAFYEAVFGRLPVSHVDSVWLQWVLHPRYRERFTQRAFDLVVGGALAAMLLPLVGPLAVLVRRDGGPALFRQVRIGRDGRRFVIYKLRTMRWDAQDASERWASHGDARITAVGRFLRRTHLDETPQLLNVLRGDMTLVGPRPEQPQISAGLEETPAAVAGTLPLQARADRLGAGSLRLRRLPGRLGVEARARPVLPAPPVIGARHGDPRPDGVLAVPAAVPGDRREPVRHPPPARS